MALSTSHSVHATFRDISGRGSWASQKQGPGTWLWFWRSRWRGLHRRLHCILQYQRIGYVSNAHGALCDSLSTVGIASEQACRLWNREQNVAKRTGGFATEICIISIQDLDIPLKMMNKLTNLICSAFRESLANLRLKILPLLYSNYTAPLDSSHVGYASRHNN